MSHLDTAYKLGAAAAQRDFDVMLREKEGQIPPVAAGPAQPAPKPVTPPPATAPRAPGSTVPPPAAPGAVNPDWKAGLQNRGY